MAPVTAPSAVPAATRPAPLAVPRWYSHRWNRASLYRLAAVIARALPRPVRLRAAAIVGTVAHARLAVERRVIDGNVARVVPAVSAAERAALVREVFRHFAICFADLVSTNRRPAPGRWLAEVHGAGGIDAALAAGRGMIVVTAHLGNWELGGRLLAARVPRPIHVVVAAEPDPEVARFLRSSDTGVRFVTRRRPTDVLDLVSALRRNEVVAAQGDRALGDESDADVTFFDEAAPFPLGPFVLARATGAPVVPAFCVLRPDRRYAITLGEPIPVAAGCERQALARWVRVLEDAIRRRPEQWFNFFDVWGGIPAR
ncbi:MAG: lysophospholipid acyltransferase family protein [Candidatus Rokubacteria bacterium]|nr:lysophospholipid acyltransferase family protein [Candidatus Rokubacteria bacterium]